MLRQTMVLALAAGMLMPVSRANAQTPTLGITMSTPASGGALITKVEPGSAADQLGLRPGYTIVAMGSRTIRDSQDVVDTIRRSRPGYWDTIFYAAHKELHRGVFTVSSATPGSRLPPRGLIGVELGDQVHGMRGARIDGVRPGSPAWQAGLEAGDLVVAVARADIRGADDFIREIANRSGEPTELTLYRHRRYVPVYVTPVPVSQTDALERHPREVSIASSSTGSSPPGDHWCDQSTIRLAFCTTVGVAGVILAMAILLEGDVPRPDVAKGDKAKLKPVDMQREFDRAYNQSEIQRRALPN